MIRAIVSLVISLAVCGLVGVSPAEADHPPTMLGPGDANVGDIKDKAIIRNSRFGYVYIAGQQSSHLRITYVKHRNSLRYRDTRTRRLTNIPSGCRREQVEVGISAVCRIPRKFNDRKMFVQIWPRLGNDYVDARTLPKRFRVWVLTDAGADVVYGGAGADFVNGAKGNDRAYGGAGPDWLRGGPGSDRLVGGVGEDRIAQG